jgi:hypothetical protein
MQHAAQHVTPCLKGQRVDCGDRMVSSAVMDTPMHVGALKYRPMIESKGMWNSIDPRCRHTTCIHNIVLSIKSVVQISAASALTRALLFFPRYTGCLHPAKGNARSTQLFTVAAWTCKRVPSSLALL